MEHRRAPHWFLYPGQTVRRHDRPDRFGQVVGMILAVPYMALVRWRNEPATFEPIDALVEVVQRLL